MDEDNGIVTVSGKVCPKKRRLKRRKILVSEQLQDFASNTTLHGLGYIARRGLTTIEKTFWLITFCLSIGICVYQISNVWSKWEDSPVIVSINEELIHVSEVPFPSVTICPQLKVFTNIYQYAEAKKKLMNGHQTNDDNITESITFEDIKMFEDISLICDKEIVVPELLDISNRTYTDKEAVDNIKKVADAHLNFLKGQAYCSWQQMTDFKCSTLNKVYTQDGICFNFNGMAAQDIFRQEEIQKDYTYIDTQVRSQGWSTEDGYDEDVEFPYPRQGRQNGADPDFVLIFRDYEDFLDKECNVLQSGYKVYVHHPADMPQSSLHYYALLPEQTSSLALKYSVVSTSPKLKGYSAEIRRCYFAGERHLRYFKVYTENNCRIECLSNYTFNVCGCVGFYMPHNTSDRICSIKSSRCMERALEQLAKREKSTIKLNPERCNCLPLCNSIEYDADVLKTEFKLKQYHTSMGASEEHKLSYSRLEMYFKNPRFLSMRRSELFGTTDFIANCGGLLGLFLGFSFLSLVEVIYFITLRLWCTFKKDLDKEKDKDSINES